ncbi:MAG: FG-GAP-like repeat-containing protein [Desulfobacterales bacterium]
MLRGSLKYKIIYLTLMCLFALATSSSHLSSAASSPKRIALLPFKINAEKDMTFLQNGIFDMLTSRLSKEGEVVVISRPEVENAVEAIGGLAAINASSAAKLGSRLNADYTLFGSLTVLGDSISIDAKMVDVTGNTPPASFFEQSQDLGGVITKINGIAAQINTTVFNRQPEVAQKAAPEPQAPKTETQAKDDTHIHPEKLVKQHGTTGEGGSPFIMTKDEEDKSAFQQFWRSASFKHLINGIALGDVDRDGKIETVVITPHTVIIYRSEGGKFYKAHQIHETTNRYQIGVDIADINADGYPEIFVTSLDLLKTGVNSYVLEYDGQNFNTIVEHSRWYYRVADLPHRGKILLGQKQNRLVLFSGKIYDMIWQNADYEPENEIKTPRNIQLMGFAMGDLLKNSPDVAVAYNEEDHIRLIDAAGKEIWKSSERYGGSTLFFAEPKNEREQVVNSKYFPMRLLVQDTDGDGDSELIAVRNYDLAAMKLEKFRKFTSSHIESLSWDGLGLNTTWKTRKISGFIRDFAVGDFDNDGKIELVAAVIQDEGNVALFGKPKSTIIAYELPS